MTAPAPTEWLKLADEIEHHAKTSAPLDEASFLLRNKFKFAAALRQAASVERAEVAGEAVACAMDDVTCTNEMIRWLNAEYPGWRDDEETAFVQATKAAFRAGWRSKPDASPPRSEGVRASEVRNAVPVCCYCDADLSCAACGREQPADAAQRPEVQSDGPNPISYWQMMYYDLLKRVDAGEFSTAAQASRDLRHLANHLYENCGLDPERAGDIAASIIAIDGASRGDAQGFPDGPQGESRTPAPSPPSAQASPDAALRAAAKKVLDANFDFRNGLPADWEGDPLQDACDELMTALGCSVTRDLGG